MARSNPVLLAVFFALICIFAPSIEARKLLNMEKREVVPSMKDSLVLGALPEGHAMDSDEHERLFVRHLTEIDRILQSVPSPGAGH
ncbi:hypothetical protein Patl1_04876 [Pistacia atlantica]|uniref:Uncharacterized protein n=1 Tax=Pistacia atlantica TaxID=434234 RepID=A0ACC1BTF1_9ROSI|nr:hypothetical protein Patl1_04876 [Pistacia atlantica]